eukprot:GHVN01041967.1.p1 GENE.GHVN01041967.1~~GHVN01041967.1.p1  ORF type:complete len:236 (-),score=31.18 GHVN01041967.1:815-1522(-)
MNKRTILEEQVERLAIRSKEYIERRRQENILRATPTFMPSINARSRIIAAKLRKSKCAPKRVASVGSRISSSASVKRGPSGDNKHKTQGKMALKHKSPKPLMTKAKETPLETERIPPVRHLLDSADYIIGLTALGAQSWVIDQPLTNPNPHIQLRRKPLLTHLPSIYQGDKMGLTNWQGRPHVPMPPTYNVSHLGVKRSAFGERCLRRSLEKIENKQQKEENECTFTPVTNLTRK